MSKLSKILVITAALTVLSAIPVMADEVTDPAKVITEAQFDKMIADHQQVVARQLNAVTSSMADKNAAAQHAATVMNQLQRYNRAEADNYINYLNKVVINLKETERIKKEVVDNYTNLSKVNPTYAAMVPQAMVDYNAAVAARMQAEANVAKAVADFKVMFP
ncbi:MAG: hypothetical protein K6A71_07955 [Lachnospiraceae bacterium]|nr:hypothetical protein [Lachnospiraceae bacterium]